MCILSMLRLLHFLHFSNPFHFSVPYHLGWFCRKRMLPNLFEKRMLRLWGTMTCSYVWWMSFGRFSPFNRKWWHLFLHLDSYIPNVLFLTKWSRHLNMYRPHIMFRYFPISLVAYHTHPWILLFTGHCQRYQERNSSWYLMS